MVHFEVLIVRMVVLLCVCTGCTQNTSQQMRSNDVEMLREANESFAYRGEPIHPGVLYEFEGWISDAGPIVTSVDIMAAHGTDRYSDPFEVAGSRITYCISDSSPNETYYYEHLGTLRDQTHVLRTTWNGGGTGYFTKLLFIRFSVDRGYTFSPADQARLLMSIVGWYPLGDRDDAVIDVLGDRVIISASRYRSEPVVLRRSK